MSDIEWITGRAAADLLGRPARLDVLLRDYLTAGMVSARAKAATLTGYVRGNAFKGARSIERDWTVPRSVWEASSSESSFDLLQGKFRTNRTGIRGVASAELIGLSFNKAELLDALELEAVTAKAVATVKASNAGAPTDKARWSAFAGAFAAAVYDGAVDPGNSQQGIYDAVAERMTVAGDENPLGIDTVRPAITAFQRIASAD